MRSANLEFVRGAETFSPPSRYDHDIENQPSQPDFDVEHGQSQLEIPVPDEIGGGIGANTAHRTSFHNALPTLPSSRAASIASEVDEVLRPAIRRKSAIPLVDEFLGSSDRDRRAVEDRKELAFADHEEHSKYESEVGKVKKANQYKSGPGSLPSVPSATSSQRDARQFKYLRGVVETRLTTPIKKRQFLMDFAAASMLILLVIGCVITVLTYGNIITSLNEAFTRMRPKAMAFRLTRYLRWIQLISYNSIPGIDQTAEATYWLAKFTNSLVNLWGGQIIPVLQKYNLNDDSTIKITRKIAGAGWFGVVFRKFAVFCVEFWLFLC